MTLSRLLGLPLALVMAAPCTALSQVRWDPAAGVYWVRVPDESGVIHEMRVEPANRVVPVIKVSTSTVGDSVRYLYRVSVDAASPQAWWQMRVPCASGARIGRSIGTRSGRVMQYGDSAHCAFEIGLLPGGRKDSVSFLSTRMAGLGTLVVIGARVPPQWPTNDPTEETMALQPLVDSLSGQTSNGLVLRVRMTTPMFDRPRVFATGTGLPILAQQLHAICTETDWIKPANVCAQLSALLPSTARATPGELGRFLDALAAGRESTIHENAFAILNPLARVVRSGLASP